MAGRRTWMACVLGLLCFSGTGALEFPCRGTDLNLGGAEDEEDLPDMNYVRSQAEAGRARSQTQLADFYVALSDFTNAVVWYCKAADQNHVPAQLSLAGCLVAGRGMEKNPTAAAQWLRRAADVLESRAPTNAPSLTVAPIVLPSARSVQTATLMTSNTHQIVAALNAVASNSPPPAFARTNHSQVIRINSLLLAAPDLQEIPTGLRAPSDAR